MSAKSLWWASYKSCYLISRLATNWHIFSNKTKNIEEFGQSWFQLTYPTWHKFSMFVPPLQQWIWLSEIHRCLSPSLTADEMSVSLMTVEDSFLTWGITLFLSLWSLINVSLRTSYKKPFHDCKFVGLVDKETKQAVRNTIVNAKRNFLWVVVTISVQPQDARPYFRFRRQAAKMWSCLLTCNYSPTIKCTSTLPQDYRFPNVIVHKEQERNVRRPNKLKLLLMFLMHWSPQLHSSAWLKSVNVLC